MVVLGGLGEVVVVLFTIVNVIVEGMRMDGKSAFELQERGR